MKARFIIYFAAILHILFQDASVFCIGNPPPAYHSPGPHACGVFDPGHDDFPPYCKDKCQNYEADDRTKCECFKCLDTPVKQAMDDLFFVNMDCDV